MLSSGAIGIVMRRKLYKIQKPKLTCTLKGPQSSLCDLQSFHLLVCPQSFSTFSYLHVFPLAILSTFIFYFNQCFLDSIADDVENDFEAVRDAIPGIVWSTLSMFSHSDGRISDIPNIAKVDRTEHMIYNETATLACNPSIAMPDLSSKFEARALHNLNRNLG